MKKQYLKRAFALVLSLAMVLGASGCKGKKENVAEQVTREEFGPNLLENGDFSNGTEQWDTYCYDGACEISVNDKEELDVDITSVGSVDYGVQLYHDGFSLEEGCVYRLTFDAYSDVERPLQMRFQINGGDYHAYYEENVDVGKDVKTYEYSFTMGETSDPAPRFCFNMGIIEGMDETIGEHHVYFDNFCLYLEDDSNKSGGTSGGKTMDIAVNQVGYLPSAYKSATLKGAALNQTARLINEDTGEAMLEEFIGEGNDDADTGEKEAVFDFSSVTDEGTYHVEAGDMTSFSFKIGKDVYNEALNAAIKMLYYQRCGTELTGELAGDFSHPECHIQSAVLYEDTSKSIDVSGGWHDAGDYGRYTVAGATAAADLLLAYENYPSVFGDDTGIPESGNGTPDVLDEARYELEWLLKMQTSEGGVYHKVTCKNFPGEVMPQEENDTLYVMPVSTTATGDFAAVMAIASRVYASVDKSFADKCLKAAKKAAEYLDETPVDTTGYRNPGDVSTGEYEDTCDEDERFWAYAELLKTTGDSSYEYALNLHIPDSDYSLGWQGVGGYGGYAILTTEGVSPAIVSKIKEAVENTANTISSNANKYGYGSSINGSYPWGSNLTIANNGEYLLLMKDNIGSFDKNTIDKQLNYLLGNNATGYCFMTGFGSLSPQSPHHRPSQATGKTVPGMIVGGPNSGLDDPYVQNVLKDTPPAKCYADNSQSYSTNEVTIYWNSPVIYLLAGEIAEGM